MDRLTLMNIISIFLSDAVFMLSMLVVVLVAACFLGRYVVISRRMILATLGIIVLQILFIFISSFAIEKIWPELVSYFDDTNLGDTIKENDPKYGIVMNISLVLSYILNGSVFLYAFIFYLIVFKEKKLLRAIEGTVCLLLLYYYMNTIAQYTYLFIMRKDMQYLLNISLLNTEENVYFNCFTLGFNFILISAILSILYFVYYKRKRVYIVKVRFRVLFIIWLFIFNTFPAFALSGNNETDRIYMLSISLGLMIPVLGAIAPVLIVMLAAEKSLKEKNEYQANYLEAELQYIQQYKRSQTEIRAFRHDIINNLSLTSMMIDEGKVDEASGHLKELLGNVKALSPSIITGDEMLDCIVSMKADRMKELGISFNLDGVIDGGLNMKPMDVCSIFANALDNAIEATKKLIPAYDQHINEMTGAAEQGSENRSFVPWIKMMIKRTEKFFVISISNAASGIVDVEKLLMSSGYTSKSDKEHHGFGLRNIRNSVEEYDGLLRAESDSTSFTLKVMIPRN